MVAGRLAGRPATPLPQAEVRFTIALEPLFRLSSQQISLTELLRTGNASLTGEPAATQALTAYLEQ